MHEKDDIEFIEIQLIHMYFDGGFLKKQETLNYSIINKKCYPQMEMQSCMVPWEMLTEVTIFSFGLLITTLISLNFSLSESNCNYILVLCFQSCVLQLKYYPNCNYVLMLGFQ